MPRKQVGMIDDALLARVDARAVELGQTRRVFTERALELALGDEGGSLAMRRSPSAPTRPPKATGRDRFEAIARPASLPSGKRGSVSHGKGKCPDCGKANGVHKGDCPAHPRGKGR